MGATEERNAALTLESIRADTMQAAAKLSEIYRLQSEADEKLEAAQKAEKSIRESISKERSGLDMRAREVQEKKRQHEEGKERRANEVNFLDNQIRAKIEELKKVNGWIATANEEYEKKQGELRDINEEIAGKEKLVKGILEIKGEYADEEKKRDALRIENTLARDDATAVLAESVRQQNVAEKWRDEAVEGALKAQNDLESAVKEKDRISADLEIYIRRVEEKYQEAFPGLRMII